jgi:hypothetical protein
MMDWTLVFVADIVVGEGARVKKWRRNEILAVVSLVVYEWLGW